MTKKQALETLKLVLSDVLDVEGSLAEDGELPDWTRDADAWATMAANIHDVINVIGCLKE